MNIGRNDKCSCGSGKKYKHCCLVKSNCYEFYYDEIYHDRKLTNKELTNFFLEQSSDYFCFMFIGDNIINNHKLANLFENIELKYKSKLSIPNDKEFKSTTFGIKYYKDGLHSFNKDCLSFYEEIVDLCLCVSPKLLFGALSKTSLLTYRFLSALMIPIEIHPYFQVIGYTLSKFLYTYKFTEIFDDLINKSVEDSRIEILNKLNYILKKNNGLPRKWSENRCFYSLINILENSSSAEDKIETDWDYSIAFQSLNENLLKWSIDKTQTKIFIDNEDNTLNVANNFNYAEVKCLDSKKSSLIRFADFFVGMIARFIKSIEETIKEVNTGKKEEIEDKDFDENRYLSESWFDVNEKQFTFALKLFRLFSSNNFASYIMFFGDGFIYLYSYLSYLASFRTYEAFKKISNEQHKLNLNAATLRELQSFFDKMNLDILQ